MKLPEINLIDLPTVLIPEYALSLNLGEIFHLCSVNTQFNLLVCKNEHFWKLKFIHDYHFTPNYTGSWMKLYQNYNSIWTFGYNGVGQHGLGDGENRLRHEQIPGLKATVKESYLCRWRAYCSDCHVNYLLNKWN